MIYGTQHGLTDIPLFYSMINRRKLQSDWHTMLFISFTSDFLHLSTTCMTEDCIMKPGVLLLNFHYNPKPHVVVINCLVCIGPEMKEQACKRGSTANVPSCIAYPLQKCLCWVQLWMHSQQSSCFWKTYNISWLFCDQLSSAHAMQAAAMQC